MVKNQPHNATDTGSTPGPGRSHMPQSDEAHVPLLSSRLATTATLTPGAWALQLENCNKKLGQCDAE